LPKFDAVVSVKFEILLPVTYRENPDDLTETPKYVQFGDVTDYLNAMTAKYGQFGGYTMSNPVAPPPVAGVYQGGPQERNFWVMIIVPEHLLNDAQEDIQEMISDFQDKYKQKEILCYYYYVTRYRPSPLL
jgi:hypothetical protein